MNNIRDLKDEVPPNRANTQRIGIFMIRNIIEAILFTIPVELIILLIPFVTKVKIFLMIALGLLLVILNLIGIRNKSVTEAFSRWLSHERNKKAYRLGSVADEIRTEPEPKTKYEKIIYDIKEYFSDENLYDAKYADDPKRKFARALKDEVTALRDAFGI